MTTTKRWPPLVIGFVVFLVVLIPLFAVSWWNSGATNRSRAAMQRGCLTAITQKLGKVDFEQDYAAIGEAKEWQWSGTARGQDVNKVLCVTRAGQPTPEVLVFDANGKTIK